MNSYYGCCGCEAKYFNINSGKRKVEQVIYSYNCYNTGKPTKFIFNYNEDGHLIGCTKYVATITNDFTIKLSDQERQLFSIMDTNRLMKADYTIIRFSEITGFRKPLDKEITHLFPLVRNGSKLSIK